MGCFFLQDGQSALVSPGESQAQFLDPPGIALNGRTLWGRPNRDLFAPIDSPRYVSASEAGSFLQDGDTVFLVHSRDGVLVYPEVLLSSYHVVNDVIDDEPVAVTSCLLAGSASVFSRKLDDRVITLALTGQLFCGNSVLYDKETQTDWLQLTGEPLQGPYHGRARLKAQALECSTWGRVRQRDDLHVLAPIRSMDKYRQFQVDIEKQKFGQKVVESQQKLDPRLLPYTQGLGIFVQGEACFFPEDQHGGRQMRQDRVGGWSILVLRSEDDRSSRIYRRYHQGRVLDFRIVEGNLFDRQTESRWTLDGRCVEGKLVGTRLEAPAYTWAYWFVWAMLYPDTRLPQ